MNFSCFVMLFLLLKLVSVHSNQKDDSLYCYDNCSGHGQCVNNICHCDQGWYGENCATSFGLSPLSAGTTNITSVKSLKEFLARHESLFLGISSKYCAKCASIETQYLETNFHGIPLLRFEARDRGEILSTLGADAASTLPMTLFFWDHGKKKAVYRGPTTPKELSSFSLLKGQPPGFMVWKDPSVPPFLSEDSAVHYICVGFFSEDDDEDTREEFEQAALELRHRHDIHLFIHFTNRKSKKWAGSSWWYPPKHIPFPAIGFSKMNSSNIEDWKFLTLTEMIPEKIPLSTWISLRAVSQDANELTPENFAMAEDLGLPMLLLFSPNFSQIRPFVNHFREAAKEFYGKITFLYDFRGEYKDKMRILGLSDPNVVSMAMNTRDVGPVPFLEQLKDPLSVRRFCIDFLAGRTTPLSKLPKSTTVRSKPSENQKPQTKDEEDIVGVQESFKDTDVGIVDATNDWGRIVLNESNDVLVFFYRSKGCLPCRQLAPMYKKMAKRLKSLKKTTPHHIVVARLDLDVFRPDSVSDVNVPAIAIFPAYHKSPPHLFFSAVAKVFTIMEWARTNADRKFEWGEDLPQFDEEEKVLFREQIKQREQARSEQSQKKREEL